MADIAIIPTPIQQINELPEMLIRISPMIITICATLAEKLTIGTRAERSCNGA
jgi:hypothetical protein